MLQRPAGSCARPAPRSRAAAPLPIERAVAARPAASASEAPTTACAGAALGDVSLSVATPHPGPSHRPPSAVTVIEPRPAWSRQDLLELWRYRELLGLLVWRDIAVRYKQTVMGAAWAIVQPVATMLIFTLVFGRLARLPSDGVPYPVFVYAGLLPWLLFSSAVTHASLSLVNQAHLLTKVYFPRLFLPAAGVGVSLVDFILSFGVYCGLLAWYGRLPGAGVLAVPPLVVLTAATALGVGLLLASLTVQYRDVKHVVPFLMQIWLFLSPVVYPVTLVPERWRWLLNLNPLTGLIGAFRSALLGLPPDVGALAAAAAVALGVLALGVWNFRRMERRFADVV